MTAHLPFQPDRILVTRTDRIGDLLVSTPVFKALRERFPKAWIGAVIFQENRELLEGNPYLDEVILYDKKGSEKNALGHLAFALRLRKKNYQAVIHLHATHRMHQAAFLAGIPVRIGWARKSPALLTHAIPDVKSEGLRHEAEYNFELLKILGVDLPQVLELYAPNLPKHEASLAELTAALGMSPERPWILINPSSSCPSKMWPASKFAKLISAMEKKYSAAVGLIGGPRDRALARRILEEAGSLKAFDLTGRLSLGTLSCLIRKAALLVSNDSGPVHLASAAGTPVVSIFGRNQPGLSPVRWRPLGGKSRYLWKDIGCRPCLAHHCRIQFLCLDVISVEDVLEAAESAASLPSRSAVSGDSGR